VLLSLLIVDDQIRELARRAVLVEKLGFSPLPSRAELDSIDFGFRLGCAFNFAGPMAFFMALSTCFRVPPVATQPCRSGE
jgi:hypothetical protein